MRFLQRLSLLLCIVLLGGCVETVFESTAGSDVKACDAQFVGNWRVLPADGSAKDQALFIVVDAGCKTLHFVEDGKEDADMAKKTHVSFAKVGERSVLMAKIDNDTKGPDAKWSEGYHYFLYERRGDEIRLRPVDDKQVAHLIIDGKLFGHVEKISRRPGDPSANRDDDRRATLRNYVAGKPEDMAQAVGVDGVFAAEPSHILKSASRAEMSKAAKDAKAKP